MMTVLELLFNKIIREHKFLSKFHLLVIFLKNLDSVRLCQASVSIYGDLPSPVQISENDIWALLKSGTKQHF